MLYPWFAISISDVCIVRRSCSGHNELNLPPEQVRANFTLGRLLAFVRLMNPLDVV